MQSNTPAPLYPTISFPTAPPTRDYGNTHVNYDKYNFVISPRGNGLDCHRTWELFLALLD